MMKAGVEARKLPDTRTRGGERLDERDLVWKMVRGERDQFFQIGQHGLGDDDGNVVRRAAMDDPMADCAERISFDVLRYLTEQVRRGGLSRVGVERASTERNRFRLERKERVLDARRSTVDGKNGRDTQILNSTRS
jgi:hypothetical protein